MKKFSIVPEILNFQKAKYNVILIFLLLSMPLILATDNVNITDDTLTIKISNTTIYNSTTHEITLKIEFISKRDDYNNEEFILYIANLSKGVNKAFPQFPYRVITSDTAENIDFAEDYFKCAEEKAKIDSGFSTCAKERDKCLNEYEGENATNYKKEADACNLDIQRKDIEIGGKDSTIEDLEKKEKDTENLKWIYAIVGAIIAVVGCLVYFGKIGKGSVKDKSMDEFNRNQAG